MVKLQEQLTRATKGGMNKLEYVYRLNLSRFLGRSFKIYGESRVLVLMNEGALPILNNCFANYRQ